MSLYERLEREMLAAGEQPASLHPLRELIERIVVLGWEQGRNIRLRDAVAMAGEEC
jgi:hypothetical protein